MRVVVVGAGGQARDTRWLLSEVSAVGPQRFEFVGFVVTDTSRLGPNDSPVLGDYSWLDENRDSFDGMVLGIGSPRARLGVAAELSQRFPSKGWPTLVHPRAELDLNSAELGRGVMLGAGVVGSVNLAFDDFSLINLGVTLGHETRVGAGVVVNHNASIAGGVHLGRGVLVGTGAVVLQYLTVAEGATIGAGAVVTKAVPAGQTWIGVPARPMGAVGEGCQP